MTTSTMPLAAVLEDLNIAQRDAVAATQGPVLLIAGPGAGKTLTLVRRTLHVLTAGPAEANEIVLCTFTEKAALELRDRLRSAAIAVGYRGDLSGLRTGTIHGVCNEFVDRYRHLTPLGNGYEVLDELTQALFLFEHFDAVFGEPDTSQRYLGRWATKWTAISGIQRYLDKITEELIDTSTLLKSGDSFLEALGVAHVAYETALIEGNRVDFAHIQKFFLDLLDDQEAGPAVQESVRYVMVDEYQDTNYVQERLLDRLSEPHGNLCVVGDEDQALYRFRGATVRNILEFPTTHPGATVIKMTTNYRSNEAVVAAYDKFMASADWSNPSGNPSYRFDKRIEPNPHGDFPQYPAVFSIWGTNRNDEAKRFAKLVTFLADNGVISGASENLQKTQVGGGYRRMASSWHLSNTEARRMSPSQSVLAAEHAAAAVDSNYHDTWSGESVLVLFHSTAEEPEIVSLGEGPISALRAGSWSCVAASVSAVGHATVLEGRQRPRERIRVTLSVSCCSVAVVIRHSDGRVAGSQAASGELYDALRQAIALEPCAECVDGARRQHRGSAQSGHTHPRRAS
jgi:hypothetical protein